MARVLPGFGNGHQLGLELSCHLHHGGQAGMGINAKDHDRCMKLFQRHHHFFGVFRLRHNAQIVFHGQHLGRAGAEDCLVVSQNDLQHYLAPLLLRINLYWSITQATPLLDFFFLVVEFEFAPAAAAALASLRTTRPVQWTSTSPGVPSTLAGKVMSNSMLEPMARSRSAIIYTPAALMFPVVAPSSPPLPWILIGSSSGNRFPVLASSDIHYTPQQTPLPGEKGIFKRWKVDE